MTITCDCVHHLGETDDEPQPHIWLTAAMRGEHAIGGSWCCRCQPFTDDEFDPRTACWHCGEATERTVTWSNEGDLESGPYAVTKAECASCDAKLHGPPEQRAPWLQVARVWARVLHRDPIADHPDVCMCWRCDAVGQAWYEVNEAERPDDPYDDDEPCDCGCHLPGMADRQRDADGWCCDPCNRVEGPVCVACGRPDEALAESLCPACCPDCLPDTGQFPERRNGDPRVWEVFDRTGQLVEVVPCDAHVEAQYALIEFPPCPQCGEPVDYCPGHGELPASGFLRDGQVFDRDGQLVTCSSDDPTDHQGDTCPVHEAEVCSCGRADCPLWRNDDPPPFLPEPAEFCTCHNGPSCNQHDSLDGQRLIEQHLLRRPTVTEFVAYLCDHREFELAADTAELWSSDPTLADMVVSRFAIAEQAAVLAPPFESGNPDGLDPWSGRPLAEQGSVTGWRVLAGVLVWVAALVLLFGGLVGRAHIEDAKVQRTSCHTLPAAQLVGLDFHGGGWWRADGQLVALAETEDAPATTC